MSVADDHERDRLTVNRWLATLYAVPAVGIAAVVCYGVAADSLAVFAVALVVAGGSWVCGALLGFIFGIPRMVGGLDPGTPGVTRPSYRSNSNLEQISDWLTKILVGLGLVEFGRIVAATERLGTFLGPGLGADATSRPFAIGLVVFFIVSGFLALYVVTRVHFGLLFARTEKSLSDLDEKIATAKKTASEIEGADVADDDGDDDVTPDVAAGVSVQTVTEDPVGAVADAYARVTSAILELHRLIYAREATSVTKAVARLRHDGYLDAKLESLASSLRAITRGAIQSESLSPDQARAVSETAAIFLRSVGHVASVGFEARVDQALRAGRHVDVERRPTAVRDSAGRAPDFVATVEGNKIVVEAYLPHRPLSQAMLTGRIAKRRPFVDATGALGLLIVVPNGLASQIRDFELEPKVAVATLADVEQWVREKAFLQHLPFAN
jgi:hypothetical protein